MKRLILLGVLTLLATGCNPDTEPAPDATLEPEPVTEMTPDLNNNSAEPEATPDQSTSEPEAVAPESDESKVYTADTYGFRFAYPERYYIPDRNYISYEPSNGDALQTTIELWQQEDYNDIQARMNEATELPPNITVQVFENTAQKSLADWKPELSSEEQMTIAIDGQDAIAFSSTGLYEHDNVLVTTPDGQYVLRLSVGYFDANDPMRQDFQTIVSSLEFM